MKTAHIALFVPHEGCPHQCAFCNQKTISGQSRMPTPEEVAAACRQGLLGREKYGRLEIAFFGGSFTAIARQQMVELLEAAAPFVGVGLADGIRVSTRPDAVDGSVLELLRSYGVTAVELGAQSMDDQVLALCGRGHTAQATCQAAHMVREAGLSLTLQMMTGLPGDSPAGAMETARRLLELGPQSVRIYPTVVLRGTALAAMAARGDYQPPGLSQTIPLCADLLALFEGAGVPVIRLGLHASRQVEAELEGGAYHPALGELCEGWRLAGQIRQALWDRAVAPGPVRIAVAPQAISRLTGHGGRSLEPLLQAGYRPHIRPDPHIRGYTYSID